MEYSAEEAAHALVNVIGDSRWVAVALAQGLVALAGGKADLDEAARVAYEHGPQTLKRSRVVMKDGLSGFLEQLEPRTRTGSAENPITKMLPATVTEQRFLVRLEELVDETTDVQYSDDRESGHHHSDFTLLTDDGCQLPINVKTAGTLFRKAEDLVGLPPDDCIPVPAYKAYGALEVLPNLLYAVSVDYQLVERLTEALPTIITRDEEIVWDLLNRHSGSQIRNAEDSFVWQITKRYWPQFNAMASESPFNVISARKATRILETKPERTPGIGLRAWGTGASAEVNVHISICDETTPWEEIHQRIVAKGIEDIIGAVNRKKWMFVFDPEI